MSDSQNPIVICPKCKTQNRVNIARRKKKAFPICGHCGDNLPEYLLTGRKKSNLWPLSSLWCCKVMYWGILIMAIGYALFEWAKTSDFHYSFLSNPPSLPTSKGTEKYYYVTVPTLNIRESPNPSSHILGKLKEFTTVSIASEEPSEWVNIKSSSGKNIGWVVRKFLHPGTGEEARHTFCLSNITGIQNGQVLKQKNFGVHAIRIINNGSLDAIVKLKDNYGTTTLAFYVKGNNQASVNNVAEGIYTISFATGKLYSKGCGQFMEGMYAQEFAGTHQLITKFNDNYYEINTLEFTLTPIQGGNIQTHTLAVENFLADG